MHLHLPLITAFCLLFLSAPTQILAAQEEADFLEKVAYNYINAHFRNLQENEKVVIKIDKIDPMRNFGGKCEGYLSAELTSEGVRSNSTVKLTCARPENPYTLYVRAQVDILKRRIMAATDLPRGTILGPGDLKEEFIQDSSRTKGIVENTQILIGSKLKRDLKAGDFFNASNICVVCKGDVVSLEAVRGGLSLKTTGEAMEDGFINDTIRVRNKKTKKVVLGTVQGPQVVKVAI